MRIINDIRKAKKLTFFIRTVLPFAIPFIFEIPDDYVAFVFKLILVIVVSCIDLAIIFLIDKSETNEKVDLFRKYAVSHAYSHIYEFNEKKRDYYIRCANNNPNSINDNADEFIKLICQSFRDVIGEITDTEKVNMHTTFIYKLENDKKWKWATQKESTHVGVIEDLLNKESTVFYQLLHKNSEGEDIAFVFYNDKKKAAALKKYYFGTRDRMHGNIGSIMGFKFGFCTNENRLADALFIISSYGKRFVEDDNENSISDLQRLISDDIFPCYQRLLEIELGTICLTNK